MSRMWETIYGSITPTLQGHLVDLRGSTASGDRVGAKFVLDDAHPEDFDWVLGKMVRELDKVGIV